MEKSRFSLTSAPCINHAFYQEADKCGFYKAIYLKQADSQAFHCHYGMGKKWLYSLYISRWKKEKENENSKTHRYYT